MTALPPLLSSSSRHRCTRTKTNRNYRSTLKTVLRRRTRYNHQPASIMSFLSSLLITIFFIQSISTLSIGVVAGFKADDNIHCDFWAKEGDCDNNPNYMLQHCATSCQQVKYGVQVVTPKQAKESGAINIDAEIQKAADTVTDSMQPDDHDNCLRWAEEGDCNNNPKYMLVHCATSCHEVRTSKTAEAKKTTTTTSLRSKSKSRSKQVDRSSADSGGSSSIRGSISTTNIIKADDNNNCQFWAKEGDCNNNPHYMLQHCATSCQKVKNSANITIKPDNNEHCDYWAHEGDCDNNPNYMLVHCATSCYHIKHNHSDEESTTTTTTTTTDKEKEEEEEGIKTDQNENCQFWAKEGDCNNNPQYMLVHCATSCENVKNKHNSQSKDEEEEATTTITNEIAATSSSSAPHSSSSSSSLPPQSTTASSNNFTSTLSPAAHSPGHSSTIATNTKSSNSTLSPAAHSPGHPEDQHNEEEIKHDNQNSSSSDDDAANSSSDK